MVKIGFIGEGQTEQIFLESDRFKDLLASMKIESLPAINAKSNGNLLPHNISEFIEILENQGAEFIFIITDLDKDACITQTKDRLKARYQDIVVIAVKQIESWFLACSPALQKLLDQPGFTFAFPENEDDPFETINQLLIKYRGRGIGKRTAGKIKLVTRMIDAGFTLPDAAAHDNCPSARYLLKKLQGIATQ